jgi:hypothetical protein
MSGSKILPAKLADALPRLGADEPFTLIGAAKRIQLAPAIVASGQNEVDSTIEGAPTLTLSVHDATGKLREELRRGEFNMDALGESWAYSGLSKQGGDLLQLTFENRLVADLRKRTTPAKVSRGKMTRAQFVRSRVVRDVKRFGGDFICPQLNVRQPLAKAKQKDKGRGQGFATGTKIRGKEGPIKIRNAEILLDTCAKENAGTKATLAAVMAGVVEPPDFANSSVEKDHDSVGVLQVRRSTARAMGIDPMDVEEVTVAFLRRGFWGKGGAIKLARENPDKTAAWVAQQCQGSAHPGRYQEYKNVAERIIRAYGGSGKSSSTRREAAKYAFTQGKPDGPRGEDAWAMAARLAEQVGWRRFVVGTDFYYISEADLMKSRSRMVLKDGEGGVDAITYDVRANTRVDQCSVVCRTKLWQAPPGSVVEIEGEGVVDGTWLVSSCRQPIFGENTSIELRRGRALVSVKREPLPTATTSTPRSSSSSSSGRGSRGKMLRPVSGGNLSPNFNQDRGTHRHQGVDIGIPVGTTVKAALGGTVTVVGNDASGYGLWIEIRHADGLSTRYAHLSRQSVKKGARVDRGQKIGESGNTGRSTGPHLHFEVRKNGVAQNPTSYV